MKKESAVLSLADVVISSPNPIYWLDLNGTFLGCNVACAKLLSLENAEQIVGKSYIDFFAKKYADAAIDESRMVIASEKARREEETIVFIDGRELLFLSHKAPLRDSNGKTVGIVVDLLSITDQGKCFKINKSLADVLPKISATKSEKMSYLEYVKAMQIYYQNIIAQMPGHVYWENCDGILLGVNDEQAKASGLKNREDIVGKTVFDFMPEEQAKLHRKNDISVLRSGKRHVFEECSILPNKEKSYYLSHKIPMRDQDEGVIGILGISIDITERKKMEQELILAKKHAEMANKLKTEFILNMEHDLRTPAAGLNGLTAVLSKDEKNPKRKNMLQLVHRASSELLNMFNDILQFSHMEKDGVPILNSPFDLKTLVEGIINLESSAACDKSLGMVLDYDDEIPSKVFGDKFRLQKILLNLIGNAVKFTETGAITAKISLLEKSENKVKVSFKIIDTGIGIPVDKYSIIFDKFVRLNPSNQNKYKGIGIGLNLVKQFVNDLQGTIELTSKVGKGSVFTCVLPFQVVCDF